jgi:hypothetical protein
VRVHAANGRSVSSVSADAVRADSWRDRLPTSTGVSGAPGPIPWRTGAMKILISDLLFPGDPAALLAPLAATSGLGIVFAPALAEEADLTWRGNVHLTDCETGAMRKQRIDESLAAGYRDAYARHFSLWAEACRRCGVILARVPCAGELKNVLAGDAFSNGAVEPTS